MSKLEDAVNTLTPEEMQVLNSDPQLLAEFKQKYGDEGRSTLGKVWDALAVPEKMSREGLTQMAEMVPKPEPTGNMALDIAKGTPRVLADTLAEAAPGFVSRGSLLTAGALKGVKAAAAVPQIVKAVKGTGATVAKSAEALSGLEHQTPGVLTEAAKDSSLMFSKGRKAAGEMFENVVNKTNIRPEFFRATAEKTVNMANEALDAKTLTPEEALWARRALEKVKGAYTKDVFREMRDAFDKVAKNISAEADVAFTRAVKGEALRSPIRLNKTGGASAFNLGLGMMTGGASLPVTSPAVQGAIATLLGLGGRGAMAAGLPAMVANPAMGAGAPMLAQLQPAVEKMLKSKRK